MSDPQTPANQRERRHQRSRIPRNSWFFEKGVPLILAGMALLTLILILFAAGVLIGVVRF